MGFKPCDGEGKTMIDSYDGRLRFFENFQKPFGCVPPTPILPGSYQFALSLLCDGDSNSFEACFGSRRPRVIDSDVSLKPRHAARGFRCI